MKNVLKERLLEYVQYCNKLDDEMYVGDITNAEAYEFLEKNIPLLDCPDKNLELTYYYRWWAYRKHIKNTPEGRVITEFFPDVPWAKKYNTINMAAGAHISEAKWLRDTDIAKEYIAFWYNNPQDMLNYTSWIADSTLRTAMAQGDFEFIEALLPQMITVYRLWEQGFMFKDKHFIGKRDNGLFENIDDRDGSECSIGGHGFRPLLNGAMYSQANVIAELARRVGNSEVFEEYRAIADNIASIYTAKCWNSNKNFFTVLKQDGTTQADVCELHGYAPWFYGMLGDEHKYDIAWEKLTDRAEFWAPYGPTFAVQSHPEFALNYRGHHCQWNGPSWPLTTAFTLDTLARFLQNNTSEHICRDDYCDLITIYSNSQRLQKENGESIPWIDENLHPYTGDWIARTIIDTQEGETFKGRERGREYNHSSFCDLVLGGLIGIVPNKDDTISVIPMISDKRWHYFSVCNLLIKGCDVDIYFDKTGSVYNMGTGLFIYSNNELVYHSDVLQDVHNISLK